MRPEGTGPAVSDGSRSFELTVPGRSSLPIRAPSRCFSEPSGFIAVSVSLMILAIGPAPVMAASPSGDQFSDEPLLGSSLKPVGAAVHADVGAGIRPTGG